MRFSAPAVLAAIALTACGGGPLSREEYREQLVEVVSEPIPKLSAPDVSSAESVKTVGDQAADLSAELEEIQPPTEVAATHARLVGAFRSYGEHMRSAARSWDGDPVATSTALRAATGDAQAWTAAMAELQRQGLTTVR